MSLHTVHVQAQSTTLCFPVSSSRMARGSNAVAAVVAALVLLFVTVIRTTHLGEARGGSVDVDHAAVLDVLNRVRACGPGGWWVPRCCVRAASPYAP